MKSIRELMRTTRKTPGSPNKAAVTTRTVVWKVLYRRSAIYSIFEPNRRNTFHSLGLLLLAVPLAVVSYPLLLFVSRVVDRIDWYEVRAHGEFAWIVDHLERIRGDHDRKTSPVVVFVRSSIHHVGLGKLYSHELNGLVLWSSARSALLAQVLLLQPDHVVKKTTIYNGNFFDFEMSEAPIQPPRYLTLLKQETLKRLECSESRFITLAVFTSTADELADPDYEAKFQFRETHGVELAPSIHFLKENRTDVILLGFPDTGKAHIPCSIPRLSEFGRVGGHHEVALTSGCLYFWTDHVGAVMLAFPFRKPALFTNSPMTWSRAWNWPIATSERFLCVPPRYCSPQGEYLSIREQLSLGDEGEAIASGRVLAIRNSPQEIIEAHKEMLARIDGTWVRDDKARDRQEKVMRIVSRFPDLQVMPISDYFLAQHSYLLD